MEGIFTFMGMSVSNLAKLFGGILVAWGVVAYFMQSSDPPSITAMIPAFMGLPLLSLGLLSDWNESNSHHYMHAAMVFALLMLMDGAQGLLDIAGNSNLA